MTTRERVVSLLARCGPLRPVELAQRLEVRPAAARQAVRRLVADGELVRLEDGRYAPAGATPGPSERDTAVPSVTRIDARRDPDPFGEAARGWYRVDF